MFWFQWPSTYAFSNNWMDLKHLRDVCAYILTQHQFNRKVGGVIFGIRTQFKKIKSKVNKKPTRPKLCIQMTFFIQPYNGHSFKDPYKFRHISSLLLNHLTYLEKSGQQLACLGAWALPTANIFLWGILSKKISL